jgi:hypothetical protein
MYLPSWLYKFWYHRIYLRSPYWYALRLKVKRHYRVFGNVDIHHLTYERMGKPHWTHFIPLIGKYFVTGKERITDLQPLTRKAHEEAHKI